MKDILISLKNVSLKYNNNLILENINLEIGKGDYFGIIGPNGGGKTTLIKTILGLNHNFSGEIEIYNQPINKFSDWSKIGYVPQKFIQNITRFPITVFEVVSLGLTKLGLMPGLSQEHIRQIEEILEITKLTELKDKLLYELSGGQQQLVYIARALVSNPEILILDEPTVGVDIASQENFYNFLKFLNMEKNITLILVSHDIDLVVNEVQKIACINKTLICDLHPKEFIKGNYLEKIYGKSRRFLLHNH